MFALREGRWKLVFGNGNGGAHGDSTGVPFGRPWRLFDLEQDPGEDRSVAEDHPEVMARMEAALERIRAAEDGVLSSDATLKSLNLAGANIGVFDPQVRNYTAIAPRGTEFVPVVAIPTVTDAHVIIKYDSGSNHHGRVNVPLNGPTTINIVVTSPDRNVTAEYTVTVVERTLAINGAPQVGQTLTADTSGISDPDG